MKTRAVLESAVGGTLLIDEAYALVRASTNDFGQEAIDTLVKFMEDHREDLTVIAAGYPEEMNALMASNPGLASRFTQRLRFPDYTDEELVHVFERLCRRHHYAIADDLRSHLRDIVAAEPRGHGFGNARYVRNLFEAAVRRQAMRLSATAAPTIDDLTTLTASDLGSWRSQ